jgi:hypothetical protein
MLWNRGCFRTHNCHNLWLYTLESPGCEQGYAATPAVGGLLLVGAVRRFDGQGRNAQATYRGEQNTHQGVHDEVVGPDMIALLRAQPDARSVGQPEPGALGLLRRDLQPLASPDALDPLVVDYPARLAQQFGDQRMIALSLRRGATTYYGSSMRDS